MASETSEEECKPPHAFRLEQLFSLFTDFVPSDNRRVVKMDAFHTLRHHQTVDKNVFSLAIGRRLCE